jgi:hypothetical protein
MLGAQLEMMRDEHAELRNVDRLTDELAIAGAEIVGLREELTAALEQVEHWRTLADYRQVRLERREGPAERRQVSPGDLVKIPGDWHHRDAGRRWRDRPERRKAPSERWELFHRDRRRIVAEHAVTSAGVEVPGWLAKAGMPAPHRTAKARLFHSRRRGGVVALAVLACVVVTAVIASLALAPGMTVIVLLGIVLGAMLVVLAEKLGTRSGHAYLRLPS